MTSGLNAVPGGSFSYDANDRLAIDTYDNNGNTISSAGIANTYDFENRMLAHGAVAMAYDGDGNRVSEAIGGTTTKFLVDDHNPTGLTQVLDEIVSGTVTRTYSYGLQRNQQINGTWTPTFYGYDGHGSVRFLTNAAGAVTDSYQYDAYGMPIASSGTTPNVFRYSGEWSDSSIGLYHLRDRYYNQATGRFWTRDPEEHQLERCTADTRCRACSASRNCSTLLSHPYIYAVDDPVNRIDPKGREAIVEYINVESEQEKTDVTVETRFAEEEREELCRLLLQAELDWCYIFSTNELQYWACTQKAHFNYYRCLIGWDPI